MPPVFSKPVGGLRADEWDEAVATLPALIREIQSRLLLDCDADEAQAGTAVTEQRRLRAGATGRPCECNPHRRLRPPLQHANATGVADTRFAEPESSGTTMTSTGSSTLNVCEGKHSDDGGARVNDNADDGQTHAFVRDCNAEHRIVIQVGKAHPCSERGATVGGDAGALGEDHNEKRFQERSELSHQWINGRYRAFVATEDHGDQIGSALRDDSGGSNDEGADSLTGSQTTSGTFFDALEDLALAGSDAEEHTSSDIFVDALEQPAGSLDKADTRPGSGYLSSPEPSYESEDGDSPLAHAGGARLSISPYRSPPVKSCPVELDISPVFKAATRVDANKQDSPSHPPPQTSHLATPTKHLSSAEFLESLPLPKFKLSWDTPLRNTAKGKMTQSTQKQASAMTSNKEPTGGHATRPSYSKVASSSKPELAQKPQERVATSSPVVFTSKKGRNKGIGKEKAKPTANEPMNTFESASEPAAGSADPSTWPRAVQEAPAGLPLCLDKTIIDGNSLPKGAQHSNTNLTGVSTSKSIVSSEQLGKNTAVMINTSNCAKGEGKGKGKVLDVPSTYAAALVKDTDAKATTSNTSSSAGDPCEDPTGDAKMNQPATNVALAQSSGPIEDIKDAAVEHSKEAIDSASSSAGATASDSKKSKVPTRPIPLKELVAPYDPKNPLANYPPKAVKVNKTKAKILQMIKKHPNVRDGSQIWNLHTKKYEATPEQTEDVDEWVKLCHKFPPILTSDGALGTWDACFSKQYEFEESEDAKQPNNASRASTPAKSANYNNPLLDILANAMRERAQARIRTAIEEARAESTRNVADMTEKVEQAKAALDKGKGKEPVYLNAQQPDGGFSSSFGPSGSTTGPSTGPIAFDHNHGDNCPNWLNTYDSSVVDQYHIPGEEWLDMVPPHRPLPNWRRDYDSVMATVRAMEERGDAFDLEEYRREIEAANNDDAAEDSDNQSEMTLRGGGPVDHYPEAGLDTDFDLSAEDFYDDDSEVTSIDDSDTQLPDGTDYEDVEARTDTETSSSFGTAFDEQLYHPIEANFAQSKTWVSAEEQNRMRYAKTVANFHHARMDDSPALPRSFKEYIELKADLAKEKHHTAAKRLDEKLAKAEAIRHGISAGLPTDQFKEAQRSAKLSAIQQNDKLPTVLCRLSVWHECLTDHPLSDWPAYKYFKADGDERANDHYRRFLPVPRARRLDPKFAHLAQGADGVPLAGPGVPYEFRQVLGYASHPDKDLLFSSEFHVDQDQQTEQISAEECPASLQELLRSIDED